MVPLQVVGAREHNLKGVDLSLPRDALVVLCGVSGSGKSSLAFDTLHAEGQRRYLEALDLTRRGQLPELPPPDVDRIEGLPPTIALPQRVPTPGPRMTVATAGDLYSVLRVLVGRCGVLHCPVCDRPIVPRTHTEIVAELLGLPEGKRVTLEAPLRAADPASVVGEVERAGFSRIRVDGEVTRLDELDARKLRSASEVRVVVDRVKVGPDRHSRLFDSVRLATRVGGGVVLANLGDDERAYVDRPLCVHDGLELPRLGPRLLSWHQPPGACATCRGMGVLEGDIRCQDCGGSRLSPVAARVQWRGHRLADLLSGSVDRLHGLLAELPTPSVVEAASVPDLQRRLARLQELSLGDLRLDRGAATLSSGELRRLRLARQVAAPLSGVLYVLDEPAAGLDAHHVAAVVKLLRELVASGNTVIAVEHDPQVIRAADHVVEFGPGAGGLGGRVVFEGEVGALLSADTTTARWLSGRASLDDRPVPAPRGAVMVRGVSHLGLSGLDVELPIGGVTAIGGPSGSGKSTLLDVVARVLSDAGAGDAVQSVTGTEGLGRVVVVDRSASRSPRSTPATFSGAWDVLRGLLAATREAQVRGLSASAFSTNVKGGRCEACLGAGERRIALELLADVYEVCPVCDGRRFAGDVLEVRWKGHTAAELLNLRVDEARPLLAGHPRLEAILGALQRVGLGYVQLGQPAHTLSGGEARRLRFARELARADRLGARDTVYLLDEPTTGLHPADVAVLLRLVRNLADEGGTVWLATTDAALVAACDRVVTLEEGRATGPVDNVVDGSGAQIS